MTVVVFGCSCEKYFDIDGLIFEKELFKNRESQNNLYFVHQFTDWFSLCHMSRNSRSLKCLLHSFVVHVTTMMQYIE